MLSSHSTKDFHSTHFKYNVFNKIHGFPDIDTLLCLFLQVKCNAQSVPTNLGGGQLGYMALVLTHVVFNSIHNVRAFIWPEHPDAFTVIVLTKSNLAVAVTVIDIAQQKVRHDESIFVYNECVRPLSRLCNHKLLRLFKGKDFDALRKSDTHIINDPIPDTISYL